MGATNSTLNYQLSQFISTDKPAWLQDYNGDMEKIDAGINAAKVAADTAQNTANSAVSSIGTISSDITSLQTDVLAHTNDITDLQGDVNTIESLIGNGVPTAGDHTLIGAINTNTTAIGVAVGEVEFETINTPIGGTLAAPFEVPADGYITMSSVSGTALALRAVNAPNEATSVIIGYADGTTTATFVKKGMLVYQTILNMI